MIQQLSIRNFKSIRELDLSCRRVNVFIGEPNTGKTNILEGFAFWCREVVEGNQLAKVLRAKLPVDIFNDQDFNSEVMMRIGEEEMRISGGADRLNVRMIGKGQSPVAFALGATLQVTQHKSWPSQRVALYNFEGPTKESDAQTNRLAPPYGHNVANLLYANKEARQSAAQFFSGSGFRLNVDFTARRLLLTKEVDETLISIPYSAASETLRRMVFFHLALDTNRDTILVLDEPDAHAYPPFTKRLAERIALDDRGNQFFLTTHSPYMLDSLLAKTPTDDLNIVLCRLENFETKAYSLNAEQKAKLMEWSMDAFFNFDRLLDSEG